MPFPTTAVSIPRPGSSTYQDAAGFELDYLIDLIADNLEGMGPKLGYTAATPGDTPGPNKFLIGDPTFAGESRWANGGLVRIADSVAASAVGSFDFLSIPATYKTLVLDVLLRGDTAAASVANALIINADNSASYDSQYLYGNISAAAAVEVFASTYGQHCIVPAASAPAGVAMAARYYFPHYSQTNFNKVVIIDAMVKYGTASGQLLNYRTCVFWRNSAAINRVAVVPLAGNWVANSRATLWGQAA
jgi:hypothetical protein